MGSARRSPLRTRPVLRIPRPDRRCRRSATRADLRDRDREGRPMSLAGCSRPAASRRAAARRARGSSRRGRADRRKPGARRASGDRRRTIARGRSHTRRSRRPRPGSGPVARPRSLARSVGSPCQRDSSRRGNLDAGLRARSRRSGTRLRGVRARPRLAGRRLRCRRARCRGRRDPSRCGIAAALSGSFDSARIGSIGWRVSCGRSITKPARPSRTGRSPKPADAICSRVSRAGPRCRCPRTRWAALRSPAIAPHRVATSTSASIFPSTRASRRSTRKIRIFQMRSSASAQVAFEAWDRGSFTPRLVDSSNRKEPQMCRSCSVKEACLRGDSGSRHRLEQWVESARSAKVEKSLEAERAALQLWESGSR